MKKFKIFLFYFVSISLYSQAKIERIIYLQPILASKKVSGMNRQFIQQELRRDLEQSGYQVIEGDRTQLPEGLQQAQQLKASFLIRIQVDVNTNDNLIFFSQIIDPQKQQIIDALNITDKIVGLEEIKLPADELKEKDSERIREFGEKMTRKIHSNPNRKIRQQNIDIFINGEDLLRSDPLINRYLTKADTQKETEEIFKMFQEQVVVTATKKAERVTDAPASMTVITARDIERYGYRTLSEALARVPEVYSHYYGHNNGADFRGFFANNVSRRVLYLLNGMKLNDKFHFGDFYPDVIMDLTNVERIEVIRGPGASLYGNNSVLGVVNIITKKPTKDNATTLLGEFSHVKRDSMVGKIQVVHNKVYSENFNLLINISHYNGSLLYDSHTGWQNGYGRDGVTRLSYSTDAYFAPDASTDQSARYKGESLPNFHIRANYKDYTLGAFLYTKRVNWVWPKDNNSFGHPDNDRVWGTGSIYFQYKPTENWLADVDFQATVSYDINTNREIADFDTIKSRNRITNVSYGEKQNAWLKLWEGAYINYVDFLRNYNPYLTDPDEFDRQVLLNGGGTRFVYHGVDRTMYTDFQLTPYESKWLTIMTGGNALHADYDNYQRFTFRNNQFIGFARWGGISADGWSAGSWLQGIIRPNKKITITTGVRYDYQYIDRVYRQLGGHVRYNCRSADNRTANDPAFTVTSIPQNGQFGCSPIIAERAIATDFTPRIAVNYRFHKYHNIRLLYGEAFRAVPSQEVNRLPADYGEAKSEKTRNYEIIYAGRFFRSFSATINAFYLKGAQIYTWNPAVQAFSAASGWDNTGGSLALKWTARTWEIWSNTTLYRLRRSIDSYKFTVYPATVDLLNDAFGSANNPYPNGYPLQEKRPLDSPEFLFRIGGNYEVIDRGFFAVEVYHNGPIEEIFPARTDVDYINGQVKMVAGSSNQILELYEKYMVPASTYVDLSFSKYWSNGLRLLVKIQNAFNSSVYGVLTTDAESSIGSGSPNAADPYKRGYEKPHQLPGLGRLYNFQLSYTF